MAIESVKIIGLEGVVKTLRELGPAASKAGGPVRFALRKAAVIIQKQEIQNLQAIILEENEGGLPSKSTGLLAKNIVVTRGGKPRGQNGETMLVRIRRKAYPKERGKKPIVTPQVARLLEYGSERMKTPHPFIRPAFDAKKNESLAVFSDQLLKGIATLERKLARANGQVP